MKAIVAVDKNWGIGKKNDLLFSLPADMAYFRQNTSGKVVVMGSNTLKSFPNGKPLKNRTNIVLYPGGEKRDDCIVVQNLEELKEELKKYNPVFPQDYKSESFALPYVVRIVDDVVRKDVEVCQGSIGWLSKEGEMQVFHLLIHNRSMALHK